MKLVKLSLAIALICIGTALIFAGGTYIGAAFIAIAVALGISSIVHETPGIK